jgi:hypothetical protein
MNAVEEILSTEMRDVRSSHEKLFYFSSHDIGD